MNRALLPATLLLTAVLALFLAVLSVFSPRAARGAVSAILRDVDPGSWLDLLRSQLVADRAHVAAAGPVATSTRCPWIQLPELVGAAE